MNIKNGVIISTVSFLIGIFLYFWVFEWIIIQRPQNYIATETLSKKKVVTFHYWKDNGWRKESEEMVWPAAHTTAVAQLINRWLSLLEESELLPKHISVNTVLQTPNHALLYVSFDRNPVSKQWSIFQKWMFIEGLLKTVQSHLSHREIQFLVRHKLFEDTHLDFSHPWPVRGYLEHTLQ